MTILKFYSPTCMPCKLVTKILEDLNIDNDIEIIDLDITEEHNEYNVKKRNVTTLPCVFFLSEDTTREVRWLWPDNLYKQYFNELKSSTKISWSSKWIRGNKGYESIQEGREGS